MFSLPARDGVAKTCQPGTFLLKPRAADFSSCTGQSPSGLNFFGPGNATLPRCRTNGIILPVYVQWDDGLGMEREYSSFLPVSLSYLFFGFPCIFLFCSGIAAIRFLTPDIYYLFSTESIGKVSRCCALLPSLHSLPWCRPRCTERATSTTPVNCVRPSFAATRSSKSNPHMPQKHRTTPALSTPTRSSPTLAAPRPSGAWC